MARLEIISGPDAGKVHEITDEVTTLGRHTDNAVVLTDSSASRFHAQVILRDGRFAIRDLGSTHGTFVNDVRNNEELLLSAGDRIRIGTTLIALRGSTPSDTTPIDPGAEGLFAARPTPIQIPGETVAFSLPISSGMTTAGLSDFYAEKLSKVAKAIQSVLDLDELLGRLMDTIFDIFRPNRGVILLCEQDTGLMVPHVSRPETSDQEISRTIIDTAIAERMSLLVSDTAEDQRFSDADSILAQAIQSAICSPLVSKDQVLGVLYIDSKTRLISFRREDLALLNIIAANAAIAIENAILIKAKLEAERLAAIGVAVAGISHYAKNILTGIMGASSLIEMGISTDNFDIVKQTWPILQRSNTKITGLVQDMLTFSKSREPHWERGNINSVMRDVFENQSQRAEEHGVDLDLELDPSLPDSDFDPTAMHDTVLNIVGNAIEACDDIENARVVLRSELMSGDDSMIQISIIDNGPGIPDSIAQRIFEPFFSTKGSQGTGLGLAVAHKSVQEHHGELHLETAQGVGTTFRITLPRTVGSSDMTLQ